MDFNALSETKRKILASGIGIAIGLFLIAGAYASSISIRRYIFRAREFYLDGAPLGIHILDDTLGHAHKPGSQANHLTGEFDVTYHITENGERRIPGNESEQPVALFLGDSFTFGHGVEDDETFSAVLQAEYWRERSIHNLGVMGWDTVRSLLHLSKTLEAQENVDLVIYGWMHFHDDRNLKLLPFGGDTTGVSASIVDLLDEYSSPSAERSDADDLGTQLTIALIREMKEVSEARGARFILLMLPTFPDEKTADDAIAALAPLLDRDSICYMNLQHAPQFQEELLFELDRHPTAEYHRRVALALSAFDTTRCQGQ